MARFWQWFSDFLQGPRDLTRWLTPHTFCDSMNAYLIEAKILVQNDPVNAAQHCVGPFSCCITFSFVFSMWSAGIPRSFLHVTKSDSSIIFLSYLDIKFYNLSFIIILQDFVLCPSLFRFFWIVILSFKVCLVVNPSRIMIMCHQVCQFLVTA